MTEVLKLSLVVNNLGIMKKLLRGVDFKKLVNIRKMSNFVELKIKQGILRGTVEKDIYGASYNSFQGIPYAKPPIGKLRFKPPEPLEKWDGVLDATSGKSVCPSLFPSKLPSSEDCLFLNVYAPHTKTDKKLPVMVAIHGGAFITGSGHKMDRGPEYIIGKNVILVTFNYRLGILGFLKLNDPSLNITGNAGLKDIVEVLRWVQENISYFNGDKDNVTVFGSSAGGASAHLLMFSPMAKNLFHKTIIQSGNALVPWILFPRNDELLIKLLGCQSTKSTDILNFLQQQPVDKLIQVQTRLFQTSETYKTEAKIFGPIIDGEFLNDDPHKLLAMGKYHKVPIMIGFLSNDGSSLESIAAIQPNFTDNNLLVSLRMRQNSPNKQQIQMIGNAIKDLYYGQKTASENNHDEYVKLISDLQFGFGTRQSVIGHTKHIPVYYYRFQLISQLNRVAGALNHGDDNRYLFSKPYNMNIVKPGTKEEKYMNIMTTMWTNFAKNANPNPIPYNQTIVWEPATENQLNYLNISENIAMGTDPDRETLEPLSNILSKL